MAKNKTTTAELNAAIQTDLEKSADAIFGGEPIATPPAETPPAETPPAETPPAETPPAETPPAETPPAETPPAETPADLAAKKVDDPYATPEGISKRASERFEKLVTTLKDKDVIIAEKDAALAERNTELKAYNDVLDATKLSGDDVVRMVELGAMMRYEPERAIKVLQGVVEKMSRTLGIPVAGVDMLAEYPDLKQRVTDREITQKDAEDLAKARIVQQNVSRETQARAQAQQQTQAQQTAATQQAESRRTALSAVEKYLTTAQTDPDFDKIAPFLAEAAVFANKNLAPDKWLSYIEGEYKKVKAISTTARASNRQGPIVDSTRSSGGTKAPATLEELANQML